MIATAQPGMIVIYAGGLYLVVERQADLLVLDGVAMIEGGSGSCRPRCTVLDTDVTLADRQPRMKGD